MLETILTILSGICGAEEGELEPDINMFEEGLLDSFGVVQLLVEVEEQLGVALDISTLAREEFATPALMAERIGREAASA